MSSNPSTPPRPGPSSTSSRMSETPLKQNMSSTNVFFEGTLEEQKEAVRTDLGPIPEVTVDFMLKHILPKSNVDASKTVEVLKQSKIWSQNTGKWQAFEGLSPNELGNTAKGSDTKAKETEVFSRLKDIYDNIVHYTAFKGGKRPPTLRFSQLPHIAPASDTEVKTKPDCCGILRDEQEIHSMHQRKPSKQDTDPEYKANKSNKQAGKNPSKPNWFDISYVEEYKLGDKVADLNDNIWKILWSLHHMMNVDHRRRFAFGLTIENETARIWFCCRQIVLVSQPFNFNKDKHHLVHLISSLAYASPTQLGYDPTMVLRWREGWQYDITVISKGPGTTQLVRVYKTICVISNTAYNIRGRATRVYEAETDDPSPGRVVLKDSWIDVGRAKEGDTLAKLLDGASKDEKKHFLTVVQHGVVQIDGMDDSTQDLILNRQIIAPSTDQDIPPEPQSDYYLERMKNMVLEPSTSDEDSSDPDSGNPAPTTTSRLFHLYHYHVSSQTSTSRNVSRTGLSSRSKASDALRHNTHRKYKKPIVYSPKHHYRIVFLERGESLMSLADSANARIPIVDQALRDITLALKFMAKKGYVHRDVSAGNILICGDQHARLTDLEFAKEYGSAVSSYVRTGTYSFMAGEVARGQYTHNAAFTPFAHNPIHDLESLWWVGVWCMMWHYPVPESREVNASELDHIQRVKLHGEMLFPSYFAWDDKTRLHEIRDNTYVTRAHQDYPLLVTVYLVRLDDFRQCIAWAYKKIQADLPRSDASYFTETLKVATPGVTKRDDLNTEATDGKFRLPVHDMIITRLEADRDKHPIPDMLLWPLGAIEEYNAWLQRRSRGMSLRPRPDNRAYVGNYIETET